MKFPPTAHEARLSEIFSSLQGEGTRLGERHLFVRFEECHMHCKYCDELDKIGSAISLDETVSRIAALDKEEGPHAFVSLTGGEPLLYLAFLKPLMERLKAKGFRLYLETSGVLWKALEEVIHLCDVVAMDMKPSSVTGEKNFYEEHEKFLNIAKAKETFIKIVLSHEINRAEFERLTGIIEKVDPALPLILQPISGEIEGHEDPKLMRLLEELQRLASKRLRDVRIVPRFHKILKIK